MGNLGQQSFVEIFNPGIRIVGLAAVGRVRPLLDEPAIKSLRRIIDCEKDSALPLADWMRPPHGVLGPKPLHVSRKVELIKRPYMYEVRILTRHVVRIPIFTRELMSAAPLT